MNLLRGIFNQTVNVVKKNILGRAPESVVTSKTLFSFEEGFKDEDWINASDSVMGGKSTTRYINAFALLNYKLHS